MDDVAGLRGVHDEPGTEVHADMSGRVLRPGARAWDEDEVAGLDLVGSGDWYAGVELFL